MTFRRQLRHRRSDVFLRPSGNMQTASTTSYCRAHGLSYATTSTMSPDDKSTIAPLQSPSPPSPSVPSHPCDRLVGSLRSQIMSRCCDVVRRLLDLDELVRNSPHHFDGQSPWPPPEITSAGVSRPLLCGSTKTC